MAIKIATTSGDISASIWETCLSTPAITASNITVTSAGINTGTFTAPNTSGKTTGVAIYVGTKPTNGGNFVVTLQEATVDTAAVATISNADIKFGWNYVRFPTPYQWTAVTAGRYRFKIANSVGNSGALATAPTTAAYIDTYDTLSTVGTTDDIQILGLNNTGVTPVKISVTGTTFVQGSGTDKAVNSTLPRSVGCGIVIGNGGELEWDTTANATLQTRGYVAIQEGGRYDRRGSLSDRTKIAKHIIDCEAASGNYAIVCAAGGYVQTNGYVLTTPYAEYVSGTGTSASHFTVDRVTDWAVNDEILLGGDVYNQFETRFIKAVYNSSEFQLSTTAGGAEAALTNTHAATTTVINITRNSILTPQNTARGTYMSNNSIVLGDFDVSWSRIEYLAQGSGAGTLSLSLTGVERFNADYLVAYGNGGGNRQMVQINSLTAQTHTGMVIYASGATNQASGSLALGSVSAVCVNQTFVDCFMVGCTSQGLILTSGYNNTFSNCRFMSNNTGGSSSGHAVAFYNAGSNIFNNCRFNSTRVQAIYSSGAFATQFNSCKFGNIGTNTIELTIVTNTVADMLFSDSTFASATLISNYLNSLEGSSINFQNMDANTNKHRWYTNHGSWWSAGAGLTDTTVRTASSLSLVSKPEDNTVGSSWIFKVPANPTSQVGIFGYIYRNATFSSGALKAELFLPGTLLTGTPDATYTFPTTTITWLPFNISAYYSGSVSRYATVRITGVTATAGAYFFVDDLYDAGTGNKVAGLDLWDSGKPSTIMVQSDFSVVPSAVWGYADTNTQANTMGQRQVDAADNSELAAVK